MEKSKKPEKSTRREFKIRRKSDGKFSGGGTSITWGDRGKTWRNIGSVKNHLHQHLGSKTYGGTAWELVEAVEMELVIAENGIHPVVEWVTEMAAKKKKLAIDQALASKRWQLKEAEAEAARLRKELGRKG